MFVFSLKRLGTFDNFPCFSDIALKICLNAISTGAHVLNGYVYTNYMINLRLSNVKLFFRACSIVTCLLGCSQEEAERSIIRSIYEEDDISEILKNIGVPEHVAKATGKDKVLAVALILASGSCESVQKAKQLLEKEPIVRNIVLNLLEKSKKLKLLN